MMPMARTSVRRGVMLLMLAALVACLSALLGLFASRASHVQPWQVVALFCTSTLAMAVGLMAGAAMTTPASLYATPSAPKNQSGRASDGRERPSRRFDRWPGRGEVPHELPEPLRHFRGRKTELKVLIGAYRQSRQSRIWAAFSWLAPIAGLFGARARSQPRRPVVVLIHGMPGSGKSALAQEFARRIAKKFPDGQLYSNLGIGRERRTPADILQDLLKALGIPEHELPDDEQERANVFRSLTARKRMLLVLDAARGYDQVDLLLPVGHRCAVIVTSRPSLGSELGAFEYALQPPDTAEALEILRAFAGTERSESAVEAAEIVHYCGALP